MIIVVGVVVVAVAVVVVIVGVVVESYYFLIRIIVEPPLPRPPHFYLTQLMILTKVAIWSLQNHEGADRDICCCNLWGNLPLCIFYTKNNGFCIMFHLTL